MQKSRRESFDYYVTFDHAVLYVCLTDVIGEAGGSCRKQADVLFLIETTSNMDFDYFEMYMLGFISDVVQLLDVDTGRTRVAVVSFSDTAQVRQNPDSHGHRLVAGTLQRVATLGNRLHPCVPRSIISDRCENREGNITVDYLVLEQLKAKRIFETRGKTINMVTMVKL